MLIELTEEIKKHPFVRITLPLILGIIISIHFDADLYICLIILMLGVLGLFLSTIKRYRFNYIKGITINLFFIFLGSLSVYITNDINKSENLNEFNGYIIGEIYEAPKVSDKTTSLKIKISAIKHNEEWLSTTGNTILYINNDAKTKDLKVGDKIIFSPHLSEIDNKGNPEEFDYKKYLSYNMIYNSDFLSGDQWQLINSDDSRSIKYQAGFFRQKLIELLEEMGISDDELSVAAALTLGYKDKLSDNIRHAYASSGAMHILAVSGLHVGIIYGIIVFIFSFFKSNKLKLTKTIIIILFIWAYAILTGLSPSVTRASLMFSIMSLGLLYNKPAGSINAVAFSALILLVINPYNITNIGFQLSYTAVIGIIILYPKIYEIFNVKNKIIDKIWALTAVSISAQIATAPLAIFYFHQFSNYFIITNYLLIPISTLTIWICITVLILGGIGLKISILAKALSFLIKTMNTITLKIESMPFSVTEGLYINIFQIIVLYLIIIMFGVFFFKSKKYKHLIIGMIGIIIFSSFNLFKDLETRNENNIIVYNINKATVVNIIDGKDNIIFANLDSISNDKIKYTASNNWLKKGLDEEKFINLSSNKDNILSNISKIDNNSVFFKHNFIGYKDIKIFVADNNFFPAIFTFKHKIKVDYIIMSNNTSSKLEDIDKKFDFKTIIIDSSNDNYHINSWLKENQHLSLNLHDVNSQGAFIRNL